MVLQGTLSSHTRLKQAIAIHALKPCKYVQLISQCTVSNVCHQLSYFDDRNKQQLIK